MSVGYVWRYCPYLRCCRCRRRRPLDGGLSRAASFTDVLRSPDRFVRRRPCTRPYRWLEFDVLAEFRLPTINNQLSVRLCSSVFKVDSMKPFAHLFRPVYKSSNVACSVPIKPLIYILPIILVSVCLLFILISRWSNQNQKTVFIYAERVDFIQDLVLCFSNIIKHMKNDLGNTSMIISIHFIYTVGNIPFDRIFAFYDPCLTFIWSST